MIPRLPQAVLAPRRGEKVTALQTLAVSNTARPGPGRPRKKPAVVKTVYKKTDGRLQSEAEVGTGLPPVKRMKLSQEEIMRLLGEDEKRMMEQKEKVEEKPIQEAEIKTEENEMDRKISLDSEVPPSIDNPREFTELLARESQYIGNMDSLFEVIDNLDDIKSEAEQKHLEFMKKLDDWGPRGETIKHPFSGFYGSLTDLDTSGDLDIPDDWEDQELFADLDARLVSESVFLNTWLPKFALKIRKDPYRALIRSINKKDPEFNIVW